MKFVEIQIGSCFSWGDFVREGIPLGEYGVCQKKDYLNWVEGGHVVSNPEAINCDVFYLWPIEAILSPGEMDA